MIYKFVCYFFALFQYIGERERFLCWLFRVVWQARTVAAMFVYVSERERERERERVKSFWRIEKKLIIRLSEWCVPSNEMLNDYYTHS